MDSRVVESTDPNGKFHWSRRQRKDSIRTPKFLIIDIENAGEDTDMVEKISILDTLMKR